MKTDIEISRETKMEDIDQIAKRLGASSYEKIGKYKAKLDLKYAEESKADSKLILVTATNPTPFGEGKTTTNIGLSMALNKLGKNAVSVLREPSLGPSFGIKGGATGGGYAQVIPMDEINLHFTGDFHAITSAVNLVASMIDNHIYHGNEKNIDPKRITWKRALDLNDRALREVIIGLGKRTNGFIRDDSFDITVATEMMAVFCLANSLNDFKKRVAQMLIGYDYNENPVTVDDIGATGSVVVLMKDALKANLVQTTENTPAIIHGGPFANIAHGCNSLIATKTALSLSDYVVTEAGFGADLGAEKFNDIKARIAGVKPDVTVIVTTVRALKYHAGMPIDVIDQPNLDYLKNGFNNLKTHIENMKKYGNNIIVSINRFPTDSSDEIDLLVKLTADLGIKAIETNVYAHGGNGAINLANEVIDLANNDNNFRYLYADDNSIKEKIEIISREIYRAKAVKYNKDALKEIDRIEALGFKNLPVCIAKTPYSLSDNPSNLKDEGDYDITINEIKLNAGAGFIVAITQNILTMPGLPKEPKAYEIDIDDDGNIIGIS